MLPSGLVRRALSLMGAYLVLSAAAGGLGYVIRESAIAIGLLVLYGGAAVTFVLMMIGFHRRFRGRRLQLFGCLVISAVSVSIAALVSLTLMVNLWEGAGLSH